jgi:hypothetical protein
VGRRGLLAALAVVVLLAGCGGDGDAGPTLTFTGSDEEQVAATVNAMTAAIAAGEGTTACALMTERGQRQMVRFGRQAAGTDAIDTCAEAVPAAMDAGYDPGDFRVTVGDVSIEPGPDEAQANCEFRGGFLLERTDAGWRVNFPYCVD